MNPIDYKIRLDCGKGGSQASISVQQGDVMSRRLILFLYNDSAPYIITDGITVILRAIKPDETIVYADCEIIGNTIRHTLTPQITTVAGRVNCQMDIYGQDNEILYSPQFDVYVRDPVVGDEEITSSDDFSALASALIRVNTLEEKLEEMDASAVTVPYGEPARAEITIDDTYHILFEIPEGSAGRDGAGTIDVSGTTTLPTGSEAYVHNIGTSENAQLEFGIPAGQNGQAATVQAGAATSTEYGNPPEVVNVGTESAAILNFVIPEGKQGPKGDTGTGLDIRGTYPTLAELQAAVPNPEQGWMYNVGTAPPYNIYMWDTGAWADQGVLQGPPGQDGAPGPPGQDGQDAEPPPAFPLALPASWVQANGQYTQTINIPGLSNAADILHTANPTVASQSTWASNGIYMDDVTTADTAVFWAATQPTEAISVIIRQEVVAWQ